MVGDVCVDDKFNFYSFYNITLFSFEGFALVDTSTLVRLIRGYITTLMCQQSLKIKLYVQMQF